MLAYSRFVCLHARACVLACVLLPTGHCSLLTYLRTHLRCPQVKEEKGTYNAHNAEKGQEYKKDWR